MFPGLSKQPHYFQELLADTLNSGAENVHKLSYILLATWHQIWTGIILSNQPQWFNSPKSSVIWLIFVIQVSRIDHSCSSHSLQCHWRQLPLFQVISSWMMKLKTHHKITIQSDIIAGNHKDNPVKKWAMSKSSRISIELLELQISLFSSALQFQFYPFILSFEEFLDHNWSPLFELQLLASFQAFSNFVNPLWIFSNLHKSFKIFFVRSP